MNRITPDELAGLRSHYPRGCRVKLICMNDPYRDLEAGTLGTVMHVDDIGTIHVAIVSMAMSYINAKVVHKKALTCLRLALGA